MLTDKGDEEYTLDITVVDVNSLSGTEYSTHGASKNTEKVINSSQYATRVQQETSEILDEINKCKELSATGNIQSDINALIVGLDGKKDKVAAAIADSDKINRKVKSIDRKIKQEEKRFRALGMSPSTATRIRKNAPLSKGVDIVGLNTDNTNLQWYRSDLQAHRARMKSLKNKKYSLSSDLTGGKQSINYAILMLGRYRQDVIDEQYRIERKIKSNQEVLTGKKEEDGHYSGHCYKTYESYKKAISESRQKISERGLGSDQKLSRAASVFSDRSSVTLVFLYEIQEGKNEWVQIRAHPYAMQYFESLKYTNNAYIQDCLQEVLNDACTQNWEITDFHDGVPPFYRAECKGYIAAW